MKKNFGFTLIEVIATIAIISIVLPTFFAVFYSIFRQQARVYILNEVKKQGDYALNVMENLVRSSAYTIYDGYSPLPGARICNNVGSSSTVGYFYDRYNAQKNWFRFYLDSNNAISSESAILNNGSPGSIGLTNSKVKVTKLTLNSNEYPFIACDNTAFFSQPVVSIKFTIEYATSSSDPQDRISLNYQTKIKLRTASDSYLAIAPVPTWIPTAPTPTQTPPVAPPTSTPTLPPPTPTSTPVPTATPTPGSGTYTYSFTETSGDDVATTSFNTFLNTFTPTSSWYIYVNETSPFGDNQSWCSSNADSYKTAYQAYSTSGGTWDNSTWDKWYKQSGGSWTYTTASYPNSYGGSCDTAYSWCQEWGIGEFYLGLNPNNPDMQAGEHFMGYRDPDYGVQGEYWTGGSVTVKFAPTRSDACGF